MRQAAAIQPSTETCFGDGTALFSFFSFHSSAWCGDAGCDALWVVRAMRNASPRASAALAMAEAARTSNKVVLMRPAASRAVVDAAVAANKCASQSGMIEGVVDKSMRICRKEKQNR